MKITVFGSSHGNPEKGRFQTSVLLECSGRNYLIDAAEPVNAMLVNRSLRAAQVSAVFITHMHIDHTGGLPSLLEQAGKHRFMFPDIHLALYLPDPEAPAALSAWSKVNGGNWQKGASGFDMTENAVYDDGIIRASFIPTRHLEAGADGTARSYAVMVKAEGKKVLFSGDLAPDFMDFPAEKARECDLIFCELTHFPLEKALPVLQTLSPEKLVFYHLHTPHQSEEGTAKVLEKCSVLDYPVILAQDGEETEL